MEAKINLRIDETIKAGLEEFANDSGQTMSEYLRELLTNHVLESNFEDGIDYDSLPKEITISTTSEAINKNYEQTFEFTYLLTWVFCKYMRPVENNGKEVIKQLKSRVELVIHESAFSIELKFEFMKILNDLNRFLLEPEYENKQVVFSIPNNHLSFDYYKLMNEIWSLKS